jgi:hypothetical protein
MKILSICIILICIIIIAIFTYFWISRKKLATGNKIVKNVTGKVSMWEPRFHSSSEEYSNYWKKQIPAVKDEIKKIGVTPDLNYSNTAIVHFRCSDVPFIEHKSYTLLPQSYYNFVSEQINKSNVDNVVIVTCITHNKHKLADVKCPEYTDKIKSWLEDKLDIPVSIDNTCMSVEDTYSAFIGCKILVSTGGSFSFIPGICKGKDFISPSLFGLHIPSSEMIDIHRDVFWTMWDKFDHIKHEETDYSLPYTEFHIR